ncbi:creatinase [[Clostridium] sordellii]|uniref:Creatinase n=1 Tax=Paraclostridium sordellii TaxID=1505 RepID=A0A9P1L0M3_PARSO|nr:creatininase [Paeniclostridium sordellii]MDU5021876.1 creatininase [Clostridiales bacterium]EPZ56729.1 creatinine amidohydrolase family protein [[Clostridium] sordellii VPI 9048] [Paeniclostridium sordellii VPI 9048]MDU1454813.1 creatininase [Paeniclostridium sordellii]CEK29665.1 creatinase [[Clostridium] sordellii] [Paeniclostridium sordellii]CEK33508.1 creatinase,Creatinine amidohydrolase,creatinine amidohydrolase family protein, mycofactocin system,Creatinine amidohydrolase [[Clostridium
MTLMAEMTWYEFDERKEKDVVILPVGSVEQHGPHLPLFTDTIISEGFAKLLGERVNGIVMPAINYGYKSQPASGGGPLFPGTIDLNGKTLISLVMDILEELIRDGVKKIAIVNSHFENQAFLLEAIDLVSKKMPTGTKIIMMSWWDLISQPTIDKVFDEVEFPGWALEHAAITETSLILKFAPNLVHMDRLIDEKIEEVPTYQVYPIPKDLVPKSGLLSIGRTSSKEKGELIINESLENMIKIVKKEFI